jgi:hypothetical protein
MALTLLGVIIGASGLGFGAYSTMQVQTGAIKGDDGDDGSAGREGIDGEDAPGGIVVGIIDPDHHDIVWGEIEIRALVYGSSNYSVSVKANQTEIGTRLPTLWDTALEVEGWYNLTVMIMDNETKEMASDIVWIRINNPVSSEKDIISFYFKKSSNPNLTESIIANIDENNGLITAYPPVDITYIDLSDLVACFTTTGVNVEVINAEQISDLTVNNFYGGVQYEVFAEDGSNKEYFVVFPYTSCHMSDPPAPIGIPDGDLNGVEDTIVFPSVGPCLELEVSIDISGVSSIDNLTVELTDPNGMVYMLWDGGATGHDLQTSFPEVTVPVTGDLATWIGQDPAGAWTLKVIESEPSGGGTDGTLNDWGISVEAIL